MQRSWPGRLERPPAVPKEPGAHQRVPRTAASSETQPGERTWLVQTVSEPLRSEGRVHAQEVPVEKLDRERVMPGAAQVQADPPSIAARGCRGREKPQTARQATPAEPPDRLRRSPAYSRAKANRDVSSGTSEVAAIRRRAGNVALVRMTAGKPQH